MVAADGSTALSTEKAFLTATRGPASNSASNAQVRRSARNFAVGSKVDRVRVADLPVAGNGRAPVRGPASDRVAGPGSRNGQVPAEAASSVQEAAYNNGQREVSAIAPLAL